MAFFGIDNLSLKNKQCIYSGFWMEDVQISLRAR